jgi:hypothetical protein
MAFLSGRVSFLRFRITGAAPGIFGPEHLEKLAAHKIGSQRVAASDGVEVGWITGDHILDTAFEQEKNVVNDSLQFAMRIDTNKIPGELLRAYAAVELKALATLNPSGKPSNKQRREAKESARNRIEEEAKDGRFVKRKAFPIMWDSRSNELLVGTTSTSQIDRLLTLFESTFDVGFEMLTSGSLAFRLAEGRNQTRGIDDAAPSAFVPGISPAEVAWIVDENSRDYIGNEFLLWLWYYLENENDSIKLSDGSEATIMFTGSLSLECPRAQTGRETISHEGPTRLPEARRAIQGGKMPRRAGLTIVRHSAQYDLTLSPEQLAISGAKLPAPEETEDRARLEERITQIRDMIETLDLIYDYFGNKRFGGEWSKELAKMQSWLAREERTRAAG